MRPSSREIKPAEDKEQRQLKLPRKNVFLAKERFENAFWMEQLPAHVWVQGEDNSILFSNRMAATEILCRENAQLCTRKIKCFNSLRQCESPCPCCPQKRIAESLQPEMCNCIRGNESFHVYHFPFFDSWQSTGRTAQILKIEINSTIVNLPEMMKEADEQSPEQEGKGAESQELVKICSFCKSIKDETEGWVQLETFFREHTLTKLSHGICPECASRHYPKR